MSTLNDEVKEYKAQLEKGIIQKAYRGIIAYVMNLKNHLANTYSDEFIVSHMYQGYMDASYFTFTPMCLKAQKLKIAIIFYHDRTSFEICLVGQNKQVQKKYRELFNSSDWKESQIAPTAEDGFAILYEILVEKPNFDTPGALSKEIETKALKFINSITMVLC